MSAAAREQLAANTSLCAGTHSIDEMVRSYAVLYDEAIPAPGREPQRLGRLLTGDTDMPLNNVSLGADVKIFHPELVNLYGSR